MKILFLHHSTGGVIWQGARPSLFTRAARKVSPRLAGIIGGGALVPSLFNDYNKSNGTDYLINEMIFPKSSPYGWKNYPFDYYNIWVKHAGDKPYMEEPTLEMLTREYQVIIFKHCYPVSNIQAESDSSASNPEYRSISNYKSQYLALRDKLHEFSGTRFILLTGAALTEQSTTEESAKRAKEFFSWVIDDWNTPGDNIHLWDFYSLETEGGLYLKDEYASGPRDSHPNDKFASRVARLFFERIIDVIENNGLGTSLTGEKTKRQLVD